MSLLSRVLAPPAAHDLAATVAALLSSPDPTAPDTLPVRHRFAGPTGLGTAAARLGTRTGQLRQRPVNEPNLYCPPAIRDDPVLAREVNDRLVKWAGEIGIYPGALDRVRACDFGRLLMLTHPDCLDPDRLLAGAKCALAEWSVDDHYVDGEAGDPARGDAAPELLGRRLAIAYAAIDPAHLPSGYAPAVEQALRDDPVMVALRSGLDNLGRFATTAQVARLRHELSVMFVAYNQEAVWRATGQTPPVWEYLLHRHENSFLPCMALIDVLGGYELPAEEFTHPAVRRVFSLAGSASVLLNDLYSMTKEDPSDTNLPRVIVAEQGCSLAEAIDRSILIHDELMHTFESEAAALSLMGSPALRRFLAGLWAWLGGSREWHRSTDRYLQPA